MSDFGSESSTLEFKKELPQDQQIAKTLVAFFETVQKEICAAIQAEEAKVQFLFDPWEKADLGRGLSAVLEGGSVIEKGGINFSQVSGKALPSSATARNPDLANQAFRATGVSVVIHPRNPYAPTSHFNVRMIEVGEHWWVGGGFDLTPYYGFKEDCVLWHQCAKRACDQHNMGFYPEFKAHCDRYFFLTHRNEARGIGGLFFDDLQFPTKEAALAFLRSVTEAYIEAYTTILARRKDLPFGERERNFQAYRRGRYVEFNLIYDRGTLFGLQSKGRTESILMSLPPQVEWRYNWQPEPGSPEAQLYEAFLPAQDWI